jgi:hypothetical protein
VDSQDAMKWLGSVLSVASLILALFSLYRSSAAEKEVARLDTIKTTYGLFTDLARVQLEHPLMVHLFATTGEIYDGSYDEIRAATWTVPEQERARLRLQERALAHHIFTVYEETYYLWREARESEPRRLEMLRGDLSYLSSLLCDNPRLLWYWDTKAGAKMGLGFAREVREYYGANVLKECSTQGDADGPFHPRKGVSR